MIQVSAIVGVVALALGVSMGWGARAVIADRAEARERAVVATEREQAMHTALVETSRRLQAQEGVARAATASLARARDDAAAAAVAAGSLREHVAQLASRVAACDSAPADGGPSAADAAGVLADLQRRADERAGVLARIADERGVAGEACQRAYDALTPK